MPDAELSLMQRIHDQAGAAVAEAVQTSSLPAAFLAAVIANESGGVPAASCFEPAVFTRLCELCIGQRATFEVAGMRRALTAADVLQYVTPPGEDIFLLGLKRLRDLCTSFGWTQIMAWHALEFGWPVTRITDRATHLACTVDLFAWFAERYQLDLRLEFGELLRCWNTGRPDGQTYDPAYVPNALRRMGIYSDLLKE
jgi:hypothetical protein